ncbi:hypothetical protein PINS_up023162 [Pythium insidiosum]|nr:hypothetical protein PINS_up011290 [Pythium insidiosum]GLE10890.1 hypothetical protein PINS_up023162 [Pythium insidiosum]
MSSRHTGSFPAEGLIAVLFGVVAFAFSVYNGHRLATTQRCVVTATELKYSATRLTTSSTTVLLDAIQTVGLRSDCFFGVSYIFIETAGTLGRDRDGDKLPSAAVLDGVLDAEGVQRAILARRDALRQQRTTVAVAPLPYVIVELAPPVDQH